MKISIVIPIYKGEQYITRTLDSILSQTYSNYEVICINDSSPDRSLEILSEYALSDSRVKVYTKPNGGTAGKAVAYGLNFVSGDYMMYSSQDDFFSSDLLEKNINKIIETGATAIVPDMITYSEKNSMPHENIIGINGDRTRIIGGHEAFVLSLNWKIHGFVLWAMDTVRKVGWYDYGLNSDEYTTRMLYYYSDKVAFSDGIFYHFVGNPNAITCTWNIAQLDYIVTTLKIEKFLIDHHFSKECMDLIKINLANDLCRLLILFKSSSNYSLTNERKKVLDELRQQYKQCLSKIRSVQHIKTRLKTYNWFIMNLYTTLIVLKNRYKN